MRHNRSLTEAIRMERFEELYSELEAGRLGCEDAAMILGGASQGSGDPQDRWKAQRRLQPASFFAASEPV